MTAPASADPLELLVTAHREGRRLMTEGLAFLRGGGGDDAATLAMARRFLRFLDVESPRHEIDEEQHVFPALRAYGPAIEVEVALRHVDDEHVAFDAIRDAAALRWSHVVQAPATFAVLAPDLLRLTERLARALARHMEHEDLVVYPLVRRYVPLDVLAAVAVVAAARADLVTA